MGNQKLDTISMAYNKRVHGALDYMTSKDYKKYRLAV